MMSIKHIKMNIQTTDFFVKEPWRITIMEIIMILTFCQMVKLVASINVLTNKV